MQNTTTQPVQSAPHAPAPYPLRDTPPKPFNARKLSAGTDAVSYTLAAFGVPDEFRGYIDALIGASGGSCDWFEASDWEIGQRARDGESTRITRSALTKWTQRRRNDFSDWQEGQSLTLVEVMPGGQDKTGQHHKSRYRLPLLELAHQIDTRAKSSRDWQRNKQKALRRAAAKTCADTIASLTDPPKRERFRRPRRRAETYEKLVLTNLEKMTGAALLEADFDLEEHLTTLRAVIDQKLDLISRANVPLKMSENSDIENPQVLEIQQLQIQTVDTCVHRGAPVETPSKAEKQARWEEYIDQVLTSETDYPVHNLKNTPMDKLRDHTAGGAPLCSSTTPLPETLTDAQKAVEACRSVGVMDIGITSDAYGRDAFGWVPVETLCSDIDARIAESESAGASKLIGRLKQADGRAFIQVDDPTTHLEELSQKSFLDVETSRHSNGQGWIAVTLDKLTYDHARRAVISYFGGDTGASGAMRWPGSHNRKYDPAPLVRVRAVQPGHILAEADIAHMLPVEKPIAQKPVVVRQTGTPYVPDWSRVAAMHPGVTPSHIDYYCAIGGLQNGVSEADVTKWLLENSHDIDKRKKSYAKEYAEKTARAAQDYLAGIL